MLLPLAGDLVFKVGIMLYLLQKAFPYLWPYIKEFLAGWIKHPHFKGRGYYEAIKKFGIILILITFLILGSEYMSLIKQLELLKATPKEESSTFVKFEDVQNYHTLFTSPETLILLNECRSELIEAYKTTSDVSRKLEVELLLHDQTKQRVIVLEGRILKQTPVPEEKITYDVNERLKPTKKG